MPQPKKRNSSKKRAKNLRNRKRLGSESLEDRLMLTCSAAAADFDMNGSLDGHDVNSLIAEIVAGTHDSDFDLTGDNLVNSADLEDWVTNRKGTLFGDANLDFFVDVSDFNAWNQNKFSQGSGWTGGDFSADGFTDVTDFNVWNSFKFQSGVGNEGFIDFGVTHDTGVSPLDNVTSILGLCGDINPAQHVSAELTLLGNSGSLTIPANGSFELTRTDLEAVFGPFEDGGHLFQLDRVDSVGNTTTQVLNVRLDTVATENVVGPDLDLQGIQTNLEVLFGELVDDLATETDSYSLIYVGGPDDGNSLEINSADDIDGRSVRLNLSTPLLDSQSYRLSVSSGIGDIAGNQLGGFNFDFTVNESFALTEIVPDSGTEDVSLTQGIEIRLAEPVDPATVTSESLKVITLGEEATGTISVSSAGDTIYFFGDQPWAASAEVRVQINGDLIETTIDGQKLDADQDGIAGGVGNYDFTTVSVSQIEGTAVAGRVVASQPDANGNDVPLQGVTIRVDGFPELSVTTNANGEFELVDVPAPDFFVHIDGLTSETGGPIAGDGFYPVVAKEFHSVPGQSTVMPFDIYLPFVLDDAISDLVPGEEMTVTLPDSQTQGDPNLAMVSLTVPADSLMNEDGSPGTEVGIFRVDSTRLPAPLPDNLDHSFDITIQADAAIFDQPAEITFPNVDGLAPGEKSLLMSFDHARAEWVVVGSMTVSADGLTLVSDPGEGVRAPGWHGVQRGTNNRFGTPTLLPDLTPRIKSNSVSDSGNLGDNITNVVADNHRSCGSLGRGMCSAIQEVADSVDETNQSDSSVSDLLSDISGVSISQSELAAAAAASMGASAYTMGTSVFVNNVQTTGEGDSVAAHELVHVSQMGGQRSENPLVRQLADLTSTALTFAENLQLMIDGTIKILDAQASVNGGPTTDPAVIAEVVEGLTMISQAKTFFESSGVSASDQLAELNRGYEDFLAAFQDRYADLYESNSVVPYVVTDESGEFVARGVSNESGSFSVVLPANSVFTVTVVDPESGIGVNHRIRTGDNGSISDNTVFLIPSETVDTDMDGLSDIVEQAIGTDANNPDTDGDGLLDSEYLQGLNPLDDRGFPTGVISNLPLPGSASDVVTASRPTDAEDILAFVATGSHGLTIMDVSQFDDAILLGQIDLAGVNSSVAVNADRTFAAVAAGSSGLHIVDVSEPMMPVLVRTVNVGGSAIDVEINNGIAYTAVGNKLVSVELVSGEKLEELSVTGGTIRDMSRDGGMLYTMDSAKSLRAIDIGGLALVSRGSLTLPNGGGELFVGGGIAYASNVNPAPGGFATVDVSDPDTLVLISDVDVPAGTDGPEGPIAANGSGLAVQGGRIITTPVLNVFDVSDPANTDDFVTQIDLPRVPTGIALAGGIAIVSDGTAGVQVVNFLPFDVAAVAPTVSVTPAFADVDPGTAGIQVVEGTTLPFELDVTDDVQARSAELLIDGIAFASDITFPFNLSTIGLDLGDGDSMITAQVRVKDSGGNTTVSAPIDIEFVPDTVSPTIVNANPVDGTEISRLQRQFRIVFDEPIAVGGVNADNIQLVGPDGLVVDPEFMALSFNDTTVTISYPELAEGDHELRINESMITDRVGNSLGFDTAVSSFDVIQSTAFWVGTSGNFNDPSNWNTGVVPGPSDDVLINVPGDQVITVSANHTLAGIRSSERLFVGGGSLLVTGAGDLFAGVDHTGGNLGGSAAINVYGNSTMTGGAIVGTGGVSNRGQLDVSGASPFVSGTLTNFGAITTSATNFYLSGGTINNLADAIFEIQSGTVDFWSGTPSIQNDGTILKTSVDDGTIDVWISQQGGTIDVQEGLLSVRRGGQHIGGDYQVAEDATLGFDSTFNIETTIVGRGAGTIALNSMWLVPDGAAAVFDLDGDVLQWNGTLDINGAATNINVLNANGTAPFLSGTLNNDGTIISTAPNFYLNSGVINNRIDGVLDIQSGTVDFWAGTSSLNNEGLIRKTGDSTGVVDVLLSQQGGTVEVQEGDLNLTRGGQHLDGDYQVADGTNLNFDSTFTLTGEVVGAGEGSINLNSIWNVPVDEAVILDFAADVMQWNGTLDVDGTATNINVLNASGTAPFLNGTLNNDATIISTAPNFYLLNGVINNQASGVLEIQSGTVDFWSGTTSINNEGVIRKTGDSTGVIDVPLSQQGGTLEVEEGTLSLTRGGEHVAGDYQVATDASLNYSNGTFTFAGDVIGTGGGRINVTRPWQVPEAATFNFTGDLLHWGGSATHTFAGDATNVGTINVSSGSPFLSGTLDNEGTINSTFLYLLSGTINNRAGATIELGTIDLWSGTTALNNEGLIRKTGDSTGIIDVPLNQQGGTLEVEEGTLNVTRGGEHVAGDYQVATDAILNYSGGTFTFAGDVIGTGEGRINVTRPWQVPEAATFNFAGDLLHWGGTTTHTFAGVATNAGTINVSSGAPFLTGTLDNEGAINTSFLYLLSGTINNRAGATFELGTVDHWSGTNSFNNEGAVHAAVGTTATIDVPFANNGTIELTEGSLLRFTRSLTLPATSTIKAQLGGNTIADYGRMSWNSGIFLNGALEVETVNGFTPMAGDAFSVISYTSAAGDFSSFDDGGTGLGYEVGGTSVNLGFGLVRSADEMFPGVNHLSSFAVDDVDEARVRREETFDRMFASWE